MRGRWISRREQLGNRRDEELEPMQARFLFQAARRAYIDQRRQQKSEQILRYGIHDRRGVFVRSCQQVYSMWLRYRRAQIEAGRLPFQTLGRGPRA